MVGSEPDPGRFVEVNGAALHYVEFGSGPTVVLLHGALSSGAWWASLVPHLSADHRVLALDSRGHGRSTNPTGALAYEAMADDVAGFIAALELDPPTLCGWSDGGFVALEVAKRHPAVAGPLIIGAATVDFDDRWQRAATDEFLGVGEDGTADLAQLEVNLGDFVEQARAWHPGGDAQWRALLEQTAEMWLEYRFVSRADVQDIGSPVLVLAGDRDEMAPIDEAVVLYRTLSRGELAICPRADHFAVLHRAPVLAGVIRDFLSRHPGRA